MNSSFVNSFVMAVSERVTGREVRIKAEWVSVDDWGCEWLAGLEDDADGVTRRGVGARCDG